MHFSSTLLSWSTSLTTSGAGAGYTKTTSPYKRLPQVEHSFTAIWIRNDARVALGDD
jgi:hypothetical protein